MLLAVDLGQDLIPIMEYIEVTLGRWGWYFGPVVGIYFVICAVDMIRRRSMSAITQHDPTPGVCPTCNRAFKISKKQPADNPFKVARSKGQKRTSDDNPFDSGNPFATKKRKRFGPDVPDRGYDVEAEIVEEEEGNWFDWLADGRADLYDRGH